MFKPFPRTIVPLFLLLSLLSACTAPPGSELRRRGDEIVIAGRFFHTGTPVILWTDPGGYDAYRVEKRFAPWNQSQWPDTPDSQNPSTPNRFGIRYAKLIADNQGPLSSADFERIRGGGWDLPTLQRCIDQFVIHYDACGLSRECFRVLHDARGLSVHFLLDIDGTIYQTLDLKERAWHATTSNDRSIGIEIANVGAYARDEQSPLNDWYEPDPPSCDQSSSCSTSCHSPCHRCCATRITIPPQLAPSIPHIPGVYHPRFNSPILGSIQNRRFRQYDLTPEQYRALINLTATLCTIFPQISCDYPKDETGNLITHKLDDNTLANYRGLLGHYHIQSDKIDPGPAFDWDYLTHEARKKIR